MLRDVTAQLLGDPSATYRRAPTQAEMTRHTGPNPQCKSLGRGRRSPFYDWKVGESRAYATRDSARAAQNGFYMKGMLAAVKLDKATGAYFVKRTF